ncbi:unnamed protein product [Polarella glacialis]|uniref:FH2 domain-containing protein n=1 Tax=Polarella glacialis TaxID=89957 RepID=A0A813DHS8_POLGL|nr:unnamed protein product [Polarella glacialis]
MAAMLQQRPRQSAEMSSRHECALRHPRVRRPRGASPPLGSGSGSAHSAARAVQTNSVHAVQAPNSASWLGWCCRRRLDEAVSSGTECGAAAFGAATSEAPVPARRDRASRERRAAALWQLAAAPNWEAPRGDWDWDQDAETSQAAFAFGDFTEADQQFDAAFREQVSSRAAELGSFGFDRRSGQTPLLTRGGSSSSRGPMRNRKPQAQRPHSPPRCRSATKTAANGAQEGAPFAGCPVCNSPDALARARSYAGSPLGPLQLPEDASAGDAGHEAANGTGSGKSMVKLGLRFRKSVAKGRATRAGGPATASPTPAVEQTDNDLIDAAAHLPKAPPVAAKAKAAARKTPAVLADADADAVRPPAVTLSSQPPGVGKAPGTPPPPGKGKGKGPPPPPAGMAKAAPAAKKQASADGNWYTGRRLHWRELPGGGEACDSIFDMGGADEAAKASSLNAGFDWDEWHELFATPEVTATLKRRGGAPDIPETAVLTNRQATCAGVVLQKVGDMPLLCQRLLSLELLAEEDADRLQELLDFVDGKEAQQLAELAAKAASGQSPTGTRPPLRALEQRLLPLFQVDRARARLRLARIGAVVEVQSASVWEGAGSIAAAAKAACASTALKELVRSAMCLRNYVQHGPEALKSAFAPRRVMDLSSLISGLREFKSSRLNGRVSLLHFFAHSLLRMRPDFDAELQREMPKLAAASRVSWAGIRDSAAQLRSNAEFAAAETADGQAENYGLPGAEPLSKALCCGC